MHDRSCQPIWDASAARLSCTRLADFLPPWQQIGWNDFVAQRGPGCGSKCVTSKPLQSKEIQNSWTATIKICNRKRSFLSIMITKDILHKKTKMQLPNDFLFILAAHDGCECCGTLTTFLIIMQLPSRTLCDLTNYLVHYMRHFCRNIGVPLFSMFSIVKGM